MNNGKKTITIQLLIFFSDLCGTQEVLVSAGENVNLTSPLFPQNYPISMECSWLITATDSARLVLVFITFSTEAAYDILEIRLQPDNTTYHASVVNVSGHTSPNVLRSEMSQLQLYFKSDSSVTEAGFLLEIFWDNRTGTQHT